MGACASADAEFGINASQMAVRLSIDSLQQELEASKLVGVELCEKRLIHREWRILGADQYPG